MQEQIKTLSTRAFTAVTFILIGYAAVLGYVATTTERDVNFFPPHIGPLPKAAAVIQMGVLKDDLAAIRATLDNELVVLNSKLIEARTNMGTGRTIDGIDTYEWRKNVRSYGKDVDELEDGIIARIKNLERNMSSFEKSCTALGLVKQRK
jgi:hypothetical protein